jgi:hypothetical protein
VGVGAQENAASREGRPGEIEEDGVSEFDDLEKKAQAYAEEHQEQAGQEINQVAGFAERDTDHQHDEQVDRLRHDPAGRGIVIAAGGRRQG